jgi:Membrane-fusion protein
MSEPETIPVRKKKKKKWPWVLLIIILILAAVVFFAYRRVSRTMDMLSSSTESYTVKRGNITSTVVGTGNLSYDKEQDVDALTGITVDKVNVEVGDPVAKGDALATLDSISVELAIDNAQQQVNSLPAAL